MGLISFLSGIWPLFKEFFHGDKIREELNTKKPTLLSKFSAVAVVDKFQKSRRTAIAIVLLLIFSLFINYRTISKLVVIAPTASRDEKFDAPGSFPTKTAKGESTVPENNTFKDLEIAREKTLARLDSAYRKY